MKEVLKHSSELKNKLSRISSVLLAGIILLGMLLIGDPRDVSSKIISADPAFYLSALGVFFLTYLPAGARWSLLCRRIELNISFLESLRVFSVSVSLNKVLPFNSGDLLRSKLMEEKKEIDKHGRVLGMVVIERTLDLLSLLTVIVASSVLLSIGNKSLISGILVSGVFISLLFLPFLLKESYVEQLSKLLPGAAGRCFSELMESYNLLDIETGIYSYLLTLVRWSLDIIVFLLLAASLDVDIGLAISGLTTSFTSLANAIPLTPGGIGAAEAFGTAVLDIMGVGYNQAFSLVLLQRSLGYLGSLLVGLVAVLLGGRDPRRFVED